MNKHRYSHAQKRHFHNNKKNFCVRRPDLVEWGAKVKVSCDVKPCGEMIGAGGNTVEIIGTILHRRGSTYRWRLEHLVLLARFVQGVLKVEQVDVLPGVHHIGRNFSVHSNRSTPPL